MTGRFRSGKMSTRMRLTAKTAVRATALTATRMVIGRRRAARMSHMEVTSRLRVHEMQERREIALRHGLRQQRPPDVNPGELILDFGLREEALCVGHFDDARQAGLI